MRSATSLIHTSEVKILLNLPSSTLVFILIVNVKALIILFMLMLFLNGPAGDLHGPFGRPGARGHHGGDPCITQ